MTSSNGNSPFIDRPSKGTEDVQVSVLLPAFNGAATLPACLRSLQRQTLQSWECVAVDDGSTDDTLDVLRGFAAADARIRIVASKHRGLVGALNTGLEACGGRFVARMDADDVMHRSRLTAQLAALENQSALAAVGCHVRVFPRAGLRDGRRAYEAWLNSLSSAADVRRDVYVECPIAHPTLMVRRDVLNALGYRDRGWAEDYDLLLRLLSCGHDVGIVAQRLLLWRDQPERLSRSSPTYGLDRFTACKAAFLAETFLRGRDEYVLWGFGDTGKAMRKALAVHGKRLGLVVELHPGRIGKLIHGARVIHPNELTRYRGQPILVSVAGDEPRRQNREWLSAMGFVEVRDFVCVA